jgi:hypothetical protein
VMPESEREELYQRLRAALQRQADLRELRAWIDGRVAARADLGQHGWPHDIAFLRETQAIMAWLDEEIARVQESLGS